MHGAFFEILVSIAVSMRLVQFYEYQNQADKVSFGLAIFFSLIIAAYFAFVTYFTCCKSR